MKSNKLFSLCIPSNNFFLLALCQIKYEDLEEIKHTHTHTQTVRFNRMVHHC